MRTEGVTKTKYSKPAGELKFFKLRLEDEDYKDLRRQAVEDDTSMQDLVYKWVRREIEDFRRTRKAQPATAN